MSNQDWWGSFNPPEKADLNASSHVEDWKFTAALWGLIAAVTALVIWVINAILS